MPIPGTLPRRDRLSETPRVPLDGNPLGIGVSADAAGWVAKVGNPAVPPPRPPARRWPPPSPSGASKRAFPPPFPLLRPPRGGMGGDCSILRVSRPPVCGIRETRRHEHGADLRALAARKDSCRPLPLSGISTRRWSWSGSPCCSAQSRRVHDLALLQASAGAWASYTVSLHVPAGRTPCTGGPGALTAVVLVGTGKERSAFFPVSFPFPFFPIPFHAHL